MVKSTNKPAGKAKAKPARGKKVVRQPTKARNANIPLDKNGLEYARLLADPCYARLTEPTYEGTGAGVLTRFEQDFIVNGTATDTAAYIAFAPGCLIGAGAGFGAVMGATGALASDATVIVPQFYATRQPGNGLLPSMSAFRVVSACMQVSFVGSELQRAGVVSVGQSTAITANTGGLTVAQLRSLSSTVVRVPDGEVEIKLRPTAVSEKFVPVNGTTTDSDFAAQPLLFATMAGIPVSTGMRVRLVAVYEWIPNVVSGCILPETAASGSGNTLSQVIKYLDTKYPNWHIKLLTAATKIAAPMLAFA